MTEVASAAPAYHRSITACRICGASDLAEVLRLREQPIATIFVQSNADHPLSTVRISLTLLLCRRCGLIQLRETVDPDVLYRSYFYRTGVTQTMRDDLSDVVRETLAATTCEPGDFVVDIGANDCTMIQMFPPTLRRVAVEPAMNIDWSHVDPTVTIINDYFSRDAVLKATGGRKVKALTACAMFYDMDDPNTAARDIKDLLADDGVCAIQVSHLYATIKDMNFYDIIHEHLEYYSLRTLERLMERNGLAVFDASMNAVNGGSLRVLVTHQERALARSERVSGILRLEDDLRLEDPATFSRWAAEIESLSARARGFITREIASGGLVIGLGASTKGNTLLQLCAIDKAILPYISERNPAKVGLRTLGTDIELISEEEARRMRPSCILVLPWNFKDEIVRRESVYLATGGKFLFLMPYAYVLDAHGERRI